MADNTNTPELEGTQPEVNVDTQTTPTPVVENKDEGNKKYSQEDVDSQMRKTRLASERDAKKSILAQLGLTLDDEDKLAKFKQAYEESLTDEERKQTELSNLQADKIKLSQDLEEKEYVIKALIELTGKKEEDVAKIVKMAKGLKTDENTIEEAIKEVISMVNPVIDTPVIDNKPESNPTMPTGQPIQQPSASVVIDTTDNPFKAGSINLTKQGQLLRTNPELARKLATEAGVNLKF